MIFPGVRPERWTEEAPQTGKPAGENIIPFAPAWRQSRFEDLYSRGMALVEGYAAEVPTLGAKYPLGVTAITTVCLNIGGMLCALRAGEGSDPRIPGWLKASLARLPAKLPAELQLWADRAERLAHEILLALDAERAAPCASSSQ